MDTVHFYSYFLATLATWYILPMAFRIFSVWRLKGHCRRSKTIILSIDDGPSNELLERILERLDRHGIRASFFFLGRNIAAHPSRALQTVHAGHEVGSHTYDHSNGWKSSPFRWAIDFSRGQLTVSQLIGKSSRLFRPPFGKLTIAGLIQVLVFRNRLCWWTVDTRDALNRRSHSEILAHLEKAGGGVVLFHDFDRWEKVGGELSHGEYVLELIDRIAEFSKMHGYRITTFDESRSL